jgi:hypothetical protein
MAVFAKKKSVTLVTDFFTYIIRRIKLCGANLYTATKGQAFQH